MAAYAALLSLAQNTVAIRNQERYHLSIDVEEEIRSIHEYVTLMLSFFEDFPENAEGLESEGRIRDIAHEIEDIIEEFMWESQFIRTESPSVDVEDELEDLKGRYHMGMKMQWQFLRRKPPSLNLGKLRGVTREIFQMMEELPAYLPAAAAAAADSSPSTPASNGAVIGLEEDQMAIKERLCGSPSQLQVHPIVGMAGIGKTTLATTIYEDPLVLEHFDICAWVVVSQDYTPHRLKKILLGLLDSMNLLEERPSREDIDEFEVGVEEVHENLEKQLVRENIEEPAVMATKIYQNLKGRRYLIVMDDVWSTEVLDDVRNLFPDDNNGSRIMLTTRLLSLVAYIDPYSPLHEMKFMDDSQSWDLFKKKVFGNRICPPELEEVGKEIVRRCAGLPLAVVLVAGVLSGVNTTRASWEEVARNVNPVVKWELEEILSLSYAHLPHHLRPCFLYMGGFPEDEGIHASILIKLWVAEGFLNGHSESLEEEAEEYLEDLVKRNLVIVSNRKSDGKIKSCSLHDIVRELCIWKAHQEKFLYVVDGCDLEPGSMIGGRRISCNHSNLTDVQGPNLRTVLCFQYLSTPSWPAFLGSSTLLKVLNVVASNYKELSLLPHVFQLFHLRHLALIGSFSVPSAISNLVNLQTLIIHPTFHRQRNRNLRAYEKRTSHFSLPLEIWMMPQLRHLILHDFYILPHPPPDGSELPLENLQTLLRLQNLVWNEKMVQMIPNVKKLGLVYTIDQAYHLHHLEDLLQLEKLQVTGYRHFSWRGQDYSFPRTLKKLTLVGGGFPWDCMGIIGSSLPNLQVLKLRDHACHGVAWEVSDDEFPQLKFLLIDNSLLEQWITESSPFPRLQHLHLHSCRCLGMIPEGIGEISTLEMIEVVGYCKSTLLESVEQIKIDQESFGNDELQVRLIDPNNEVAGSGNTDMILISVVQPCKRFSYAEIRLYSENFSYRIGDGVFGEVYKGEVDNGGSSRVAIKRVSSSSKQRWTDFAGEMEILAKFRHHNLVSLIGYCTEVEKILVYEYMPNNTLADHLFYLSRNGSYLSWNDRLKICVGAARGLDYLHSGCGVIHGGVCSSVIFLDENFTSKLSDFGLAAKQFYAGNTKTSVEGKHRRYTLPTYLTTEWLTRASDAYAFGMVLLEVLSETQKPSASWAQDKIRNGEAEQIVDLKLRGEISQDCLKTFLEVVERCLDEEPRKRLKMAQVVAQLELALQQ